ncbi:Zinc finger C-x8-C-x5-C-x3-H type domain containing protein, putative [Babesia bigemina]|uniref:Zinc finger C-x8-C-x5-C-x3-H type domain containing protein, putative n=1 Tax=Babesia bigemina TaxID=5866 RepID=A0A061D2U5_BABBI|nr:Zinc finger C-x8-C-x5-C-x3-H type domain containing protein, putative [Babesia bigemina]CDR94402.1 Zinc finger C-x8-C-x5-C-x3-H type domain containing protein, putative [Babesia bigemina]|eukprot:XP_012766588.1 Zinc finger C-x8-C-x5-C-x3-H type domain containing protein, putative [Babesia bigemina]
MPILSEEDLERFRTKVCSMAASMRCDFGVERCNYSHNVYWARRCPFYLRDSTILRYIPAICPDVELGPGTSILKNTCPRGNNCAFAHSLEEMHYHPLVYKTEICDAYREGNCRTYYCHKVHGLAEYRIPREYVLPRKRGLHIPEFKHVTIVDNVRGFQSGVSSCGHMKDKQRLARIHDGHRGALYGAFSQLNQHSILTNSPSSVSPSFPPHSEVLEPINQLSRWQSYNPRSTSCLEKTHSFGQSSLSPRSPTCSQERNALLLDRFCRSNEELLSSFPIDQTASESCEKVKNMRWSEDRLDQTTSTDGNLRTQSSAFPMLFPDELSSVNTQNPSFGVDGITTKSEAFSNPLRPTSNKDKSSDAIGRTSLPWYDRMPCGESNSTSKKPLAASTIKSLNTMLQRSLRMDEARDAAAKTGGNPLQRESAQPSRAERPGGPNVERNAGGWKDASSVLHALSLQCMSEEEDPVKGAEPKEVNSSLLDYVYRTVAQQCQLIAGKCVQKADNQANMNEICKDTYNLWQLLTSIRGMLYDGAPVVPSTPAEETCKSEAEEEANQWSAVSGFYCELVDSEEDSSSSATSSESDETE